MPRLYLHKLTSPTRTKQSNFHLGAHLALVAGAIHAGGLLAIGRLLPVLHDLRGK